jgi:hypothetical protein
MCIQVCNFKIIKLNKTAVTLKEHFKKKHEKSYIYINIAISYYIIFLNLTLK